MGVIVLRSNIELTGTHAYMHHQIQVRAGRRNVFETIDNQNIAEWGNRAPNAGRNRLNFRVNRLDQAQGDAVIS